MPLVSRSIELRLNKALKRGKSILLLGPRQTGKTTLVKSIKADLYINLARPATRQAYERDPARLTREVEAIRSSSPLVVIDEIQKVTPLLDAIQDLIDSQVAHFILTGSSARKLRRDEANLLPGRVVILRMDPLLYSEMADLSPSLKDLLIYGSLPQIILEKSEEHREEDLFSYVTTYLEEEVRSEALVRNVSAFSNFLQLAALESGKISNFQNLSKDVGVSHQTIVEYYQILVDCLVAERVEAFSQSRTRKRLIKSPKFLIYDLGVRRLAAGEGKDFPEKYLGDLFEQWAGLELLRHMRKYPMKSSLLFWRTQSGAEIDWIVDRENQYTPIEVKWTESPRVHDARHIHSFIEEHPNSTGGYIICRAPRVQKLSENVTALPWQELHTLFEKG